MDFVENEQFNAWDGLTLTPEIVNTYSRGLRVLGWTCPDWDSAFCDTYNTQVKIEPSRLQDMRTSIQASENEYCVDVEGAEEELCIFVSVNYVPDLPRLRLRLARRKLRRRRFRLPNRRLKFRLEPKD